MLILGAKLFFLIEGIEIENYLVVSDRLLWFKGFESEVKVTRDKPKDTTLIRAGFDFTAPLLSLLNLMLKFIKLALENGIEC